MDVPLYARAPSALLLWFHPWAGLCWGCMGGTRGCAGSAAGSRVLPVTERAWENLCGFITTFVPFVLLKAGGVKEGKLMQSNRKVGSSKLCYCSSTVLVISGFLLEFWGQREEMRGERVREGWPCCLFSLLPISHPSATSPAPATD